MADGRIEHRDDEEQRAEEQFRDEMATLTLGSGAAAMVLARSELVPGAPRYRGSVTRSATEWNHSSAE